MQNSENKPSKGDVDHCRSSTKVLSRTTIANLGRTRTCASLKIDHSKDKELINTGLHKLVSNFASAKKLNHKPSKIITLKKNDSKIVSSSGPTIPDRDENSHIVLTKQMSVDKYTMTDFEENEKKINLESSVFSETSYRDLQWTDPRLLKKYSLVKQPYKKSLTIPYVNKSEYGSDVVEDSDNEAELFYSKHKHFLFKCLYYFCTASVSFIGTMCGITLITVVLWKILDEQLLHFNLEAPQNALFFQRHFSYLLRALFHMIHTLFGKIMRLLTISTKEVYAEEEEPSSWYKLN